MAKDPGQYTVKPFSVNYHKNSKKTKEGFSPCAICGKPVKDNPDAENPEDLWKHFAEVVAGGADWGDASLKGASDPNDAGYMGLFSVGNDCHRKYKKPGAK